jgi:hypothetical protein
MSIIGCYSFPHIWNADEKKPNILKSGRHNKWFRVWRLIWLTLHETSSLYRYLIGHSFFLYVGYMALFCTYFGNYYFYISGSVAYFLRSSIFRTQKKRRKLGAYNVKNWIQGIIRTIWCWNYKRPFSKRCNSRGSHTGASQDVNMGSGITDP